MKARGAYERLVRQLLFTLEPERAHDLAIWSLQRAAKFPLARRSLHAFRPGLRPRTVFGMTFPHPVGLAAGFDKNGLALPAWAALGFGFVEIGTVTAKAQPGNAKPRIFRLPQQEALINRLGFNNDGADVVAERLQKLRANGHWPRIPIGINIGKSKVTLLEAAAEDYVYSFEKLSPLADYIALNVSSPNTPGLRSLQEGESLSALLHSVAEANRHWRKPVLVKISPDLSPAELEQVITICEANEIAGIIATNTTIDHTVIPASKDQSGGLSGKPLREKSTAIIRAIRARSRLPIIASGGIFDAESAREKFEAGAELLQIYTGYIYRGPRLLRELVEEIA